MMNKNRTPHVITIVSMVILIVLGLASASQTPDSGGQAEPEVVHIIIERTDNTPRTVYAELNGKTIGYFRYAGKYYFSVHEEGSYTLRIRTNSKPEISSRLITFTIANLSQRHIFRTEMQENAITLENITREEDVVEVAQIIIERTDNTQRTVYAELNGKTIGHFRNAGEYSFLVSQEGSYTLRIRTNSKKYSRSIKFTTDNPELKYIFRTEVQGKDIILLDYITGGDKESVGGIEGAIQRARTALINDMPENSTIVVLNVASDDGTLSGFVVEELEFQLFSARKFIIVDRKTLDTIRTEQNFQMSGDVSDSSAVTIGQMLGANIVITGSITGTGSLQRLSFKALDVETARIITIVRESF